MKTLKISSIFGLVVFLNFLLVTSCEPSKQGDKTDTYDQLVLAITGLQPLANNYKYEGWIIVDEKPVSTGKFNNSDQSGAGKYDHTINFDIPAEKTNIGKATSLVLSIEPAQDGDPGPSDVKILAGTFDGVSARLSIDHQSALGVGIIDKLKATKFKYVYATPTDGNSNTDETSGIWFLQPGTPPTAGITDLPTLPSGWKYEAWLLINGKDGQTNPTNVIPLSMGKFTSASGADEASPFNGSTPGPKFPGEDFLFNKPAALSQIAFPYVINTNDVIAISIEPAGNTGDDDVSKPSSIVPFVGLTTTAPSPGVSPNPILYVYGGQREVSGTATKRKK